MRCLVILAMLLAARAADAQEGPNARERVFILADSAQWVLAYHTLPESRTVVCEVATREQPGALFRHFWEGRRSFTLYLMASSAPLDSFVLQVDEKRPIVRKPSYEERTKNVLNLRGIDSDLLVRASRLRVQVFYPGREKQDLEIDLTGFTPLYWRAMQLDCIPPQVHEEQCRYFEQRYPGEVVKTESGYCGLRPLPRPRPTLRRRPPQP